MSEPYPPREPEQSTPPAEPPKPACSCPAGPWRWFLIPVIIIIIFIMLKSKTDNQAPSPQNPGQAIIFLQDHQAGLEQAQQQNKPVLIAFHASWCGYCEKMKKETYPNPDVIEIAQNFIPIYIDIDKQGKIANLYQISPIPAYVILNPSGELIDKFEGFHSPLEFSAKLQGALNKI